MVESQWVNTSQNSKTGPVIQQFIGSDREQSKATCIGCPLLQGVKMETGKTARCYAHNGLVALAHTSVINAAKRGKDYGLLKALKTRRVDTRYVRFGTVGDPAYTDVPDYVKTIRQFGLKVLGYTHFWEVFPGLNKYLMASCDNWAGVTRAVRTGWRASLWVDKVEGRKGVKHGIKWAQCPAQYRKGLTTCNSCGLCDGSQGHLVPVIVFERTK